MGSERTILVTGGTGLLGQALVNELRLRGRHFHAPARRDLDLARPEAIESWLTRERPSAVVNAAAYSDVGRAELPDQHDEVMRLNRDAPLALARCCSRLGIRLIHLSTDYVFDGTKGAPYLEGDVVAPLQVYGRSKLEGEQVVLDRYPAAAVVRTSTLFGPGRRERPHYVDAVLGQARRGGALQLVRLPVSSPTYAPDLAQGLLRLLEVEATGLVHLVNRGECSRMELAREAIGLAGPDFESELVERPEEGKGPSRPAYSVLDVGRYTSLTGRAPRTWQEALADYLQNHAPARQG